MTILTVGIDLAKNVFAVHGVNEAGKAELIRPAVPRDKLHELIAGLPPCVVGMEACSGAHHWARLFQASGHTVRLIAPKFVTPYRMTGKNDAAADAAICEAAGRPHMRFVPVKTPAQQALLAIHRLREGYKEDRTACINRIRGLLTEFGIVFTQSPEALRLGLADVLEDASNELPGIARLALQEVRLHWIELECHIASCDERITAHVRSDPQAKAAAQLSGIGPVTASAMVATVGDFKQFKNGSQFGSWLGLVPRQNSSGGKTQLGRITKRGDDYLRTLLIQGAKSAVMTAHKRSDKISQWLVQLLARVGWQTAVVALANKNARIVWALLAKGRVFDPNYVSVKPGEVPSIAAAKPA